MGEPVFSSGATATLKDEPSGSPVALNNIKTISGNDAVIAFGDVTTIDLLKLKKRPNRDDPGTITLTFLLTDDAIATNQMVTLRTKIDGVSSLIEKFIEFPKALNGALKRAGRKANTIILQTMRAKVPKKGKKLKLKRKATVKEAARDLFSTAWATIEAKLKGKKKRKKKAKQYYDKECIVTGKQIGRAHV